MPGFLGATVGTTTQRGYGRTHQRARKEAFEALPEWSPCARCSKPMWKHSEDSRGRSSLHYDHAEDGTYLGFSHGSCNRSRRSQRWSRRYLTSEAIPLRSRLRDMRQQIPGMDRGTNTMQSQVPGATSTKETSRAIEAAVGQATTTAACLRMRSTTQSSSDPMRGLLPQPPRVRASPLRD